MNDQPTTPGGDTARSGDEFLVGQQEQDPGAPGRAGPRPGPGPGHSRSAGDDYQDSGLSTNGNVLRDAFESIHDQADVEGAGAADSSDGAAQDASEQPPSAERTG